ncbi:MAG TPA: hypothetical protein VE866_15690 [Candidatus Binatia bacterium]|nr:hypothetical protein [Candidatus Binatia bacterium]
MKKLILVMTLLASGLLYAQTPFDGTWMTKLDTAKLPTKPDKYSLSNNMYECLTCVPKVSVKADGSDQKVTGHPYFDTIAVKVVNASSVEITQKKDGKVMYTDTETISPDGNALEDKFTDTSGTQPVTGEATSKRVAAAPPGAHALSGSWRTEKINSVSDNGLTVTYQGTENGLKMSDQNGNSYDAKFDGKDYPINGDPGHTMVSLKRVGKSTIEETDKRDGKVVGIGRMTVSADGKSIAVEYNDKLHGTKTSFTMEKKS